MDDIFWKMDELKDIMEHSGVLFFGKGGRCLKQCNVEERVKGYYKFFRMFEKANVVAVLYGKTESTALRRWIYEHFQLCALLLICYLL